MNNPRCKDGTLDMRFACNKGLDKYGSSSSGCGGSTSFGFARPSMPVFNNYSHNYDNDSTRISSSISSVMSSSEKLRKDGQPDMRYKENRIGGKNKDGSDDMRLKQNRIPGKNKDGSDDMRNRKNRQPEPQIP